MRTWLLGVALAMAAGCTSTDLPIRSSDPVASLTLTPVVGTLQPSEAVLLRAAPRDARGRALTERSIAWSIGDPSVAHVSAQGIVTAFRPGTTTVTASSEGRSAVTPLTVVPRPGGSAAGATR